MAPQQAVQTDDDLLIIADDSASNSTDEMDFSFDFSDETPSQESKKDVSEEAILQVDNTAAENSSEDMILDISELTIDTANSGSIEHQNQEASVSVDNVSEENNSQADTIDSTWNKAPEETLDFSFWDDVGVAKDGTKTAETHIEETDEVLAFSDASDETKSESSSIGASVESMNEILSATIAKLETRKKSITDDKSGKKKKEDEIKAKIKELEDEYAELEAEIIALDTESDKITANILQLEKMKLDPVKEHNAKRTVKK